MTFIQTELLQSARLLESIAAEGSAAIQAAADLLIERLLAGNKVLIFGNGGSAADAQHFAAELVGRYRRDRRSLPAIALTTDTSLLTAIGNDYSFEQIFQRQVSALAEPGDVVIGISASGRSKNVAAGIQAARQAGAHTLVLIGAETAQLGKLPDLNSSKLVHLAISVPSRDLPRVQEAHAVIIHILCDLIEKALLEQEAKLQAETSVLEG
jgi:D-sedoheptulose 7-phosphate isomerase